MKPLPPALKLLCVLGFAIITPLSGLAKNQCAFIFMPRWQWLQQSPQVKRAEELFRNRLRNMPSLSFSVLEPYKHSFQSSWTLPALPERQIPQTTITREQWAQFLYDVSQVTANKRLYQQFFFSVRNEIWRELDRRGLLTESTWRLSENFRSDDTRITLEVTEAVTEILQNIIRRELGSYYQFVKLDELFASTEVNAKFKPLFLDGQIFWDSKAHQLTTDLPEFRIHGVTSHALQWLYLGYALNKTRDYGHELLFNFYRFFGTEKGMEFFEAQLDQNLDPRSYLLQPNSIRYLLGTIMPIF